MPGTVLVTRAVLLGVALSHLVDPTVAAHRRDAHYEQYDALQVAVCEARCSDSSQKNSCTKLCLINGVEKPGTCPDTTSPQKSPFASVCMETCKRDSECPGTTKCCRHKCGVTCQSPEDLHKVPGLPATPQTIRITEGRRRRKLFLDWSSPPTPNPTSIIIYVLQERHHIGRHLVESRFTRWTSFFRTQKTDLVLRHFAKPGRWYQFRVAAVNRNGTKGFSEASASFCSSATPRPPKAPQNVTVGPLVVDGNGTLKAEVRWSQAASDLPVQKYKVFWSRRLHGTTALDSVLVHQGAVPKAERRFLLKDLQPDSLYFIQIQAMVQYGKERLKGEKSGLVLNTTNYTNVTAIDSNMVSSSMSLIEEPHIQKIYYHKDQLKARIAWKCSNKSAKRYTVSWWSGPCGKANEDYSHFKLAATTKACVFDLFDLAFDCKYRISIRAVTPQGLKSLRDSSITLKTPTCYGLKSRYEALECP